MRALYVLLVLSLVACSEGEPPAVDAGTDASIADASIADAAPDGGPVRVTAQTESGPIVGTRVDGDVLRFRRVPYAAPPVGDLRFAAPAPVTPWTEPLDATGPGSRCVQRDALGGSGPLVGEEDCLHVDLWTPSLTGSRPVMIWIHGGGFVTGAGSDESYDAWRIASEGDVVVVNINYRLDVFGFLAHSSLASTTDPNGNWGVLDQQAALRWARDNAAHFGGDPANITVFGQSAGGMSTCFLALSPTASGIVSRYIDQSGPCALLLRELATANELGDRVATALGCSGDVPACLRAATSDALMDALVIPELPGGVLYQEITFPHRPTLDGVTFVEQPLEALRAGHLEDADYVMGATSDEGTAFHHPVLSTPVMNETEMREALGRLANVVDVTPAQIDSIVARYPVASYPSANDALTAVTTDMFICAMRYGARLIEAAGRTVYLYRFDQEPARLALPLGAYHGADLIFLFGNRSALLGSPTNAPELGPAMRGYWTRFARTGDPAGTPAWPEWTPATDTQLRLSTAIEVEDADATGRCDFWDTLLDAL